MSIEQDLTRIANALETLVNISAAAYTGGAVPSASENSGGTITGNAPPPAKPAAKTALKKKAEPAPVVEEPSEFDTEESADQVQLTTAEIEATLRRHAKAVGSPTTIKLMIKHGADKVTPKIATIPQANYQAIYDEAEADLKKVEGKK